MRFLSKPSVPAVVLAAGAAFNNSTCWLGPWRVRPRTRCYSEGTAVLLLQPRLIPPSIHETPGAVPLRVLVVEDDADTASTYELLLQLQGLEVRTAPDGPKALAFAQAFKPDVVLMDIALPGMDGWEVARQIKAESTGTPPFLIAVTGYGREEDRQKSAEAGIDLHLVKPADPALLTGLLKRFRRVVQ
jgi:CheY-like chemotaxis protein